MALSREEQSLLALQDTDLKLSQLEDQFEKAPYKQRIALARQKIAEGEKRLAAITMARDELEAKISELQEEIDDFSARMNLQQAKMQNSSDHREVETLARELESLIKQKEKRENEGLGLMEKRSAFGESLRDTEEKLEQLREIEAREMAAYKELYQKAQEAKTLLQARRAEYLPEISPQTVARYEKIRATKNGIGVALYHDGKCDGCSVMVPFAQQAAIENAETLSICPSCKRLLVVDS